MDLLKVTLASDGFWELLIASMACLIGLLTDELVTTPIKSVTPETPPHPFLLFSFSSEVQSGASPCNASHDQKATIANNY